MTRAVGTRWIALAFALLLLASQSLGAVSAPATPVTDAGRVLGHAGFAYIGVFRTYAAAVLWNRLDPVFHGYYRNIPLRKQKFLMPTVFLVQVLDPQLEQPYYLGAYALAARGDFKDALALAERGVEENPKSGLLRANHVQILLMQDPDKNLKAMQREAAAGLAKDMYWSSPEDLFEGLAIFRSVYRRTGDKAMVDRIQRAMDRISAAVDTGDHDHNGDGVQDH